jgi:flagellar L-ring protein precursor FlgH
MKSNLILNWSCLTAALLTVQPASAENLWQHRISERAYLFNDSKARNIGDNVTVIVSQTTDVANTEARKLDKSTSTSGSLDVSGSSDGGFGEQGGKVSLDVASASERKFDGSAAYNAAQDFSDRLTCTVMDVLPNGNMVISGERRVRVAGEERTLVMTGVIRGLDIGPDNSISSQYISQFHMEYETGGMSQRFTRPGWLGRAMNVVWPW